MIQNLFKTFYAFCFSAVTYAFANVRELVLLTFLFVIADCITAWRLSRRVSKMKCEKDGKIASGKFKSKKMFKTVFALIIVVPSGLMLAYYTQKYLLYDFSINLPKIFAGFVICWQIISIIENESSCNDALWAKFCQKILANKSERHFDVDLNELKEEIKHKRETAMTVKRARKKQKK